MEPLGVVLGHISWRSAISAMLTVALLSGKDVLQLEHFSGNGQELKELCGRALRLTPQRLRLVTSTNVELQDPELVAEGERVTCMVKEGQELPEWCQQELKDFRAQEVDALQLLEGSTEISPKLLGKVFMVAIERARKKAEREWRQLVKDTAKLQDTCQDDDDGDDDDDDDDIFTQVYRYTDSREQAKGYKMV